MTLYSPRYDQLLQGVSRQHPSQRAVGQNAEQINCISDIVQGLRRRPRFKLMGDVLDANEDIDDTIEYTCHMYERGDGLEAYIMIMNADGDWQVYNAYDGEPIGTTQLDPGPLAYVTEGSTDVRNKLAFYTIADSTFILNKEVEVEESAGFTDSGYDGVLVWVKRSMYGKTYSIDYSGVVKATVTNPATVSVGTGLVDKQLTLSTTTLANSLATQLGTSGYTAGNLDNVLYIDCSGSENTAHFNVDDTGNGEDVVMIKDAVDSIEDLPPHAPHNYKVKVKGLGKSDFDDFWVRFVSDEGTNWQSNQGTEGTWEECAAPYIKTGIDPATMPHIIKRQYTGDVPYFICTTATWENRAAGDDTTNPMPSFVGRTIEDIFTYQNRLWFLSGENACATRAFDYYFWFAESAAQASDDDPIDSSSSDNEITELKYGLTFNNDLFIISPNSQFIHPGDTTVKPATFAVKSHTRFTTNPAIKPTVLGNSLVFPSLDDNRVSVWEYRKDPVSGLPDVNELTAHIGDYISNDGRITYSWPDLTEHNAIESIAAHPSKGILFLAIGGDIYVLQMYYKNNQRVQLAWHKWQIAQIPDFWGWFNDYESPKVTDVFVVENKLIAIVRFDAQYSPNYYPRLLVMDLDLETSSVDDPEILLDMSYETTALVEWGPWQYGSNFYDARVKLDYYKWAGQDTTYHREQWIDMVVTSSSDDTDAVPNGVKLPYGYSIHQDPDDGDEADYVYFNAPKSWVDTSFQLICGCYFTSETELSQPYIRDMKDRVYTEQVVIDDVVLDLLDTVECDIDIYNATGDSYTHEFTGLLLNDFRSELGQVNHITQPELVSICNDREMCSVTIKSENSPYIFKLLGCTWHVNMHTNGRRS